MEAKEVIQKILTEAQSQAAGIAAQTKKQEDSFNSGLNAEIAAFDKETSELALQAAQEKKSRILAAARMAASKELLAVKRQLLDELFTMFKDRLNSLPDHEYKAIMASLMKKAVIYGDEQVQPGRNEHRIDPNLINEVNGALGAKGKLTLSPHRADCDKGFVLVKGNVRTNVSVDVLVEQIRTDIENKLAAKLFG